MSQLDLFSQIPSPAPLPAPKPKPQPKSIDLSQPVSKEGLESIGFVNLLEGSIPGLIDCMSWQKGKVMVLIFKLSTGRRIHLCQRGKENANMPNLTLKEVKEVMQCS